MNNEEDKRRSFLKHILVGTAAVIGTAAIVKPVKAQPVQPGSTVKSSGETLYHESESFKKYYQTLRS